MTGGRARPEPTTALCTYDDRAIYVRGRDLCELMGRITFTEMMFLNLFGRMPSHAEKTIIEASLIKIVEHGMSPSAIAARMAYTCAPDSLQGAACAGLQTAGSVLVGAVENLARLLAEIVNSADGVPAAARRVA